MARRKLDVEELYYLDNCKRRATEGLDVEELN